MMRKLKVAILDMYKGEPNQGMRNIREILERYAEETGIEIEKKIYDVRTKSDIPGINLSTDHSRWERCGVSSWENADAD